MLPVMFKNSWFPTVFDDFFNSDAMATATTTAPAVNVREDLNEYTMEMAVPGIKKEYWLPFHGKLQHPHCFSSLSHSAYSRHSSSLIRFLVASIMLEIGRAHV